MSFRFFIHLFFFSAFLFLFYCFFIGFSVHGWSCEASRRSQMFKNWISILFIRRNCFFRTFTSQLRFTTEKDRQNKKKRRKKVDCWICNSFIKCTVWGNTQIEFRFSSKYIQFMYAFIHLLFFFNSSGFRRNQTSLFLSVQCRVYTRKFIDKFHLNNNVLNMSGSHIEWTVEKTGNHKKISEKNCKQEAKPILLKMIWSMNI